MVLVKRCMDSNCTIYIWLEDGRVIQQPKDKCDKKQLPDNFTQELEDLSRQVDQTVYVGRGTFDVNKIVEGQELNMDRNSPNQTKEQKIVSLKKQIQDLQSGT